MCVAPSPSVFVLLCLLVCCPICLLYVLLILFSGGLPCFLQGSLAEPLAPLPSSSGGPPSPMSCPLPELPTDSSHVGALSEAVFWCGEMACHRSMVIASHRSYNLALKAYLEAAEKLIAPLTSRKGKEKQGSFRSSSAFSFLVLCCTWCADMLGVGRRL